MQFYNAILCSTNSCEMQINNLMLVYNALVCKAALQALEPALHLFKLPVWSMR